MNRVIALCLALAAAPLHAADYAVGDHLPVAPARPAEPTAYQEVSWDDLLPPSWDPRKVIADLKLERLDDGDPRAVEAMKKLQAMWRDAPSNPAIAGKAIRIPGFTVPLEFGKETVTEFLLVPYFGACIHVPPPPANQVIHVLPSKAVKLESEIEAVWVEGVIELDSLSTELGDAGYQLRATKVEPYEEPR